MVLQNGKKVEDEDGSDSYAVPIAPMEHWDIRVAAVVLSSKMKKVSSRAGMRRTVETSPFFKGWVDSIPQDLEEIKEGITNKDFEKVGEIAEANCLKMHATTLGANPPFTYWLDTTLSVMQTVQQLRDSGIPAYFTIDAGPNVKVLYLPEHEEKVQETLRNVPGVTDVKLSRVGQGISYLEDENLSNSSLEIRVPGKLMIAGEFAVLEPHHHLLAMAIDRFIDIRVVRLQYQSNHSRKIPTKKITLEI